MSLYSNIKNSTARAFLNISKRLFGVTGDGDDVAFIDRFWGKPGSSQYSMLEKYNGLVYAIVTVIAQNVATYEPIFSKKLKDGNLDEIKTHQFLRTLSKPNPNVSQYDLFETTQTFMELQGESFWYLPLGKLTKVPREIYLLRADNMTVNIGEKGEITGYLYRKDTAQEIPFLPSEVQHIKMPNPLNPYRGMSTLQASLTYVDTEKYTAEFSKNFMANNATPSGIVSVKGNVSREAFTKMNREWQQKYEGPGNAGKTAMVRDMDIKFEKLGLGLSDVDLKALKEMTIDQVLMMFRVPRSMLGLSDDKGLGRASVETLEYIFSKRVIEPKMLRLDQAIQTIVTRFYPKDDIVVGHKNIIPEDKEFALKERQAGVDIWIERNEIREQAGYEPVEGGDNLYAGIQQIPINEAIEPEREAVRHGKVTITKKVKESEEQQYVRKENFRKTLVTNARKWGGKYIATLKKLLEKQRKTIISRLNPQKAMTAKGFDDVLFTIEDEIAIFKDKLLPIAIALYEEQGALALSFMGLGDTEVGKLVITDQVKTKIESRISRMATNYGTRSIDKLTATLTEGVKNGESLSKLADRVNATYRDLKGYEAERIARTETMTASNLAAEEAYMQNPAVIGKRWLCNPDACEYCQSMAAEGDVSLGVPFKELGDIVTGVNGGEMTIDYDDIEVPDLHPNCECTIEPVSE